MLQEPHPMTIIDTSAEFADALTGSAVRASLREPLNALLAAASAVVAVPCLYLAKSALGINLLPWHSPLHDLLYHFIR